MTTRKTRAKLATELTALNTFLNTMLEDQAKIKRELARMNNPWGLYAPREGDVYYRMYQTTSQSSFPSFLVDYTSASRNLAAGFYERPDATAMAEALDVIIEMRMQAGYALFSDDLKHGVYLQRERWGEWAIFVQLTRGYSTALPTFVTPEYALAAIEAVGKVKVINALKTLAGIKE